MAQHQHIHEGTARELAPLLAQHPNQRFRLIELSPEDEATAAPNDEVLAMLRDVARMKEGMKPMEGTETDRLLWEARAGAMYNDSPDH